MSIGIYIKGIEMPESCSSCRFVRGCQAINRRIDAKVRTLSRLFPIDRRHSDCPLIEVPEPHGRLGDLDAVERNLLKMQQAQTGQYTHGVRKSRAVLRDAPTIIPASEEGE